jgi:hypothetical protein
MRSRQFGAVQLLYYRCSDPSWVIKVLLRNVILCCSPSLKTVRSIPHFTSQDVQRKLNAYEILAAFPSSHIVRERGRCAASNGNRVVTKSSFLLIFNGCGDGVNSGLVGWSTDVRICIYRWRVLGIFLRIVWTNWNARSTLFLTFPTPGFNSTWNYTVLPPKFICTE